MSSPTTAKATTDFATEAVQTSATALTGLSSNESQNSPAHVQGILPASHWADQDAPEVQPLIARTARRFRDPLTVA